jgi:hypothetical protein
LIINILTQDILPIPKCYSEDLRRLVELLLQKDPNLRPNINEIISINFVLEKMRLYNLNISQDTEIKKNYSSKGMTSQSNSNLNSNSTCYSSNNINFNSISSPVNNLNTINSTNSTNDNEMNSNLFSLGYGNLLKEIDEVDEEQNVNSNSITMSPRDLKNDELNKLNNSSDGSKDSAEVKIVPLIMAKHNKNSASSYVAKSNNDLLKNLNFQKIESTKYKKNKEELEIVDDYGMNSPILGNPKGSFFKKNDDKNKNRFYEQDLYNADFSLESPEKGINIIFYH